MTRRRATWSTSGPSGRTDRRADHPVRAGRYGHRPGTSRLMLWRAAGALDGDGADKVTLCAMAKLYVTDACFGSPTAPCRLLGGYGYLRGTAWRKIVRDLRVHLDPGGTNGSCVVIGRSQAARATPLNSTTDSYHRLEVTTPTMTTIAFPGAGQYGRTDGGQPRQRRLHRARISTRSGRPGCRGGQGVSRSPSAAPPRSERRCGDHHVAQRALVRSATPR